MALYLSTIIANALGRPAKASVLPNVPFIPIDTENSRMKPFAPSDSFFGNRDSVEPGVIETIEKSKPRVKVPNIRNADGRTGEPVPTNMEPGEPGRRRSFRPLSGSIPGSSASTVQPVADSGEIKGDGVKSHEKVGPVKKESWSVEKNETSHETFSAPSALDKSSNEVLPEKHTGLTVQSILTPVSLPETRNAAMPSVMAERVPGFTPTPPGVKKENPEAFSGQTVINPSSVKESTVTSLAHEPATHVKNLQIPTPEKKGLEMITETSELKSLQVRREERKTTREIADLLPVIPEASFNIVNASPQTKLVIGNLIVEVTGSQPEKMPQPQVTERIVVHHEPARVSLSGNDSSLKVKFGLGQL